MSTPQSRQCLRKRKHLTLAAARAEAKKLHKLVKADFDAYQCQFCSTETQTYFHVGTRRSTDQARNREARAS